MRRNIIERFRVKVENVLGQIKVFKEGVRALSRSLMYVVTSFGLVFLTEALGHYGVWFILFPITIGFIGGFVTLKP